jgi:hypothetical protein
MSCAIVTVCQLHVATQETRCSTSFRPKFLQVRGDKVHVFSEVIGKREACSGYIYKAGVTPSNSKARRCSPVGVEIICSVRPAAVTLLRVRVAKS